jgi:hypothetical protein
LAACELGLSRQTIVANLLLDLVESGDRVQCLVGLRRLDMRWSSNFGHNDRFVRCHFPFVDGGRQIAQC